MLSVKIYFRLNCEIGIILCNNNRKNLNVVICTDFADHARIKKICQGRGGGMSEGHNCLRVNDGGSRTIFGIFFLGI